MIHGKMLTSLSTKSLTDLGFCSKFPFSCPLHFAETSAEGRSCIPFTVIVRSSTTVPQPSAFTSIFVHLCKSEAERKLLSVAYENSCHDKVQLSYETAWSLEINICVSFIWADYILRM